LRYDSASARSLETRTNWSSFREAFLKAVKRRFWERLSLANGPLIRIGKVEVEACAPMAVPSVRKQPAAGAWEVF
jgi:hypothetical protein